MRVEFLSVDIEGFMSIGRAQLDLQKEGLILVSGRNDNPRDNSRSNGSGKSSIFEAIFYAATGYTVRGSKDVVNYNYPKGCKVELKLKRGSDIFTISRYRSHHELGTGISIYMNDEDISGKTMKDSELVIKQYIPEISWSIVSSIVVLGQGLPNKLTGYTPSGRKQLLEELSQTGHLVDEIKSKLSIRKLDLENEAKSINQTLLGNSTESATLVKVIKDLEQNLTYTPEELDRDLIKYVNDLNRKIEESSELSKEEASYIEESTRLTKQESELRRISDRISFDLSNISRDMSSLSKNICPTCKRPLLSEGDLSTKLAELKSRQEELNADSMSVQSQLESIKSKITELSSTRSSIISKKNLVDSEVMSLTSKLSRLDEIKSQVKTAVDSINKYKDRLKYLEESSESLAPSKSKIDQSLQSLGYIDRALSKEFKSYLLRAVIDYLNKKIDKYSKELFSGGYIKFEINGNNLDIVVDGKSYESLSGGERQKADLCVQFSLREMLVNITGFNCNILVLDEVFDNLDEQGCNSLLNLINQMFGDLSSVYIITHHNDIQIPKDREILVVKNQVGLSSVEVVD